MSKPKRLLADTSSLIDPPSEEEAKALGLDEAEWLISAMSVAELHKGVLVAEDPDERARRLEQLGNVEAQFDAVPFGADAARVLGRYMADARRDARRLRVRDALIAATAVASELPVLTRDADFERFGAELLTLGPEGGAAAEGPS